MGQEILPTVQMKGPAGIIRVNVKDVEEYEKQGYKLRKAKKEKAPAPPDDDEDDDEEQTTEELVAEMNGPQLAEFVEAEELEVEFTSSDRVADKRQKVLDALAERDEE